VEEFSHYASIPIINALTDLHHPCQILSDLLTIIELGGYKEKKIVWVGDGNNVANSWIQAAAILGLNLVLACPEAYSPDPQVVKEAQEKGVGTITVMQDPFEAVKDAEILYTDVWTSMGQEEESVNRRKILAPYQVNAALLKEASKEVIVMHCLPAHRGEEITEEILEGPMSVVWDQSENKLHMHKAILETLILKNRRKGERA
jgi:ornithine carbamoyltransferase